MKTENRKTDKEIKKQTVRQTNIKNGPHTEQRAKTDANRKTDIGRNKSQESKFKRSIHKVLSVDPQPFLIAAVGTCRGKVFKEKKAIKLVVFESA